MKKLFLFAMICGAAIALTGCGKQTASENKTPAEIQAEVQSMSAADIQAKIDAYKKAIEAKTAELKAEGEKLKQIPLTEQLGDEAKKIQGNMGTLKESISKLTANMNTYAEGLKAKK